jgi:N-acetylneuraminate synthase
MPAYKIASADITNKPFIEYIAKKNKPIILSTGASNLSEIFQALEWIKSTGNSQISLLHCILNYPTEYANANLGMIKNLSEVFVDNVIGYSDHTNPEHINDILVTSWLLGAQIIEKHYTWNKKLSGNDHYHSMDYQDLKSFVSKLKFLKSCMGSFDKHSIPSEEPARKNARRSLVSKKHIEKGKTIDYEDITWKRPGFGIPPNMIDKVIGGIACVDIPEDTILDFKKVIMKSDSDINP